MPWAGPEFDGDFPSLGWTLLDWWSSYLPSPRDHDKPLIFTDEQAMILVRWFAVHPRSGRRIYRRGQSRRSKGWGKSPLEAAKAIAELCGPVRFDGWDAAGQPVGRPWGVQSDPQALVQIGAVSEDQTENTHAVVYDLLTANDGRAAEDLRVDPGLTRTYLRDGARRGKLEPVTASAGSREGQPVTYGVLDETHLWTPRNGGVKLARTIRRNVAKMNGSTYETTNSFEPGQQTAAEATFKAHARGSEGVFVDAVEAPRLDLETATDDELRDALSVAYGDAWWVDLDRLVREIRDPDTPAEDAKRFYLNWNTSGSGVAVDPARWDKLARPLDVPAGTRIGVGFDGSISGDCTVLRGCTADGYSFLIDAWERPRGPEGKDWRVPRRAVHEAVARAFDTWDVGLMFCDPPKWWDEIETWADLYRAADDTERVVMLDTNQPRRWAPLVDRWLVAVREGKHTHDGDALTDAHVKACHLRKVRVNDPDDDGRTMYVIVKGDDGRKIDAAVADVLALAAAQTMPESPVMILEGALMA